MGGFSDARIMTDCTLSVYGKYLPKKEHGRWLYWLRLTPRTFLSLMVSGIFCMTLTISHKATM